jgi:predicted mannosyl-3-phosphoglycerate phosphatase (HAD superfamily)
VKLVVTHYLRSLRERDELDAILPDLLAESGFEVLTRPRRGTRRGAGSGLGRGAGSGLAS